MKNNPKVAVIVPIYNVEKYLSHCLDSLVNQTYSNLVFVLVNDGSSDKSAEMAKSYCLNDSRFILIDKKINEGQSKARNVGLNFLKGNFSFQKQDKNQYKILEIPQFEAFTLTPPPQLICDIKYIEFLDSDDYLETDCIEISVQYAQQYQLDLVCAGINRVSDRYKKISSDYGIFNDIKHNQILEGKEIVKRIQKNYFYAVCNVLINFHFLSEIKLNFIKNIIYEDHHFGSLLFLKAKRVMILENYFYNQVNSLNSTTRPKEITKDRLLLNFRSWRTTIEKLEKDIQLFKEKQIIEKNIKKFYFPMMCESFSLLDFSLRKENKNEVKKYKKYGNLKTFLILNFPKIFFLLRKIKKFFRE